MTRLSEIYLLSLIQLDENAPHSLYKQLYQGLRQAIVNEQLAPSTRLPSIRDMASMLNISRNTITNALDELIAEGYLETRPGAGTYVAPQIPDDLLKVDSAAPFTSRKISGPRHYSERSQRITNRSQNWVIHNLQNPAFQYGLPALDHFPHDIWGQLTAKHYRNEVTAQFDFASSSGGYGPLRESIVEYLQSARGVQCTTEQVVIVSGAHQGIYLAAQILLDPGDKLLIEEPGFTSAHRTFISVGAELIPVPIDDQGINIRAGAKIAPDAKVAFVKPSRHHPIGTTMSLERRHALVDWVQQVNGWLIEDDYGGAFTYYPRPLPALQGLDDTQRVIYIGTFSKVLFPSLRLGYLVVPEDLVDKFRSLRSIIDSYIPTISQVILANFMEQGHFTRHLRRMRQLYADRKAFFIDEADQGFGERLRWERDAAGTSIAAWLPEGVDDVRLQQQCAQQGITVMPISPCYLTEAKRSGLVFGYGGCDEAAIRTGLQQVKTILTSHDYIT